MIKSMIFCMAIPKINKRIMRKSSQLVGVHFVIVTVKNRMIARIGITSPPPFFFLMFNV